MILMFVYTGVNFRKALEARLDNQARAEQMVDPNRLRRSVAFERFQRKEVAKSAHTFKYS